MTGYVSDRAKRAAAQRAANMSEAENQAQQDLVDRVGDGSQLTPEDFTRLTLAERTALYNAAPETYRSLRDGRKPGDPWRPTTTPDGGVL